MQIASQMKSPIISAAVRFTVFAVLATMPSAAVDLKSLIASKAKKAPQRPAVPAVKLPLPAGTSPKTAVPALPIPRSPISLPGQSHTAVAPPVPTMSRPATISLPSKSIPGGGVARNDLYNEHGLSARQIPGSGHVFTSERGGGGTVVAFGNGGYSQREFSSRGQTFVSRTWRVRGRTYTTTYRSVRFGGRVIDVYAPIRYYPPSFYLWINQPSPVIAYSGWGWQTAPWYPVFGVYFAPWSVYAGPYLWLSDYIIAAGFEEAYYASLDSVDAAANTFSAAMPDDLKRQIADEVRLQLARQQSEAQAVGAPQVPENQVQTNQSLPVLDNRRHTLEVYRGTVALAADGGECALTEGDILGFDGTPLPDGSNAAVWVNYAKLRDCPAGSQVSVPISELQEMSNHMTEVMEQGLSDLQIGQGRNGLPQLPASLSGTKPAAFASDRPGADPDVQNEIQQTVNDGEALLNSASTASMSPPSGPR